MHEALNIDKKIIAQFVYNLRDESFEPSEAMLDQIQTKVLHYLKFFYQGTKQGLREIAIFQSSRITATYKLTPSWKMGNSS